MIVYVETNFILELALAQEQRESCERIIQLCEIGSSTLVLPAFCIAESYEAVIRNAKSRTRIASDLANELRQLSRSEPYKAEIEAFQNLTSLLVRSSQEEGERLTRTLEHILRVAKIIPLEADIVRSAAQYRAAFKLQPQDSLVYASVLHHLTSESGSESCFINRNTHDFDDPDIEESLINNNCKMLFSFDDGYNYIQHQSSGQSILVLGRKELYSR